MDDLTMESDKWLWQPKTTGPIFLRLPYRDAKGRKKQFVCSLNTNHLPTARKILRIKLSANFCTKGGRSRRFKLWPLAVKYSPV